jgi:two-component system CheB/CheR fusion protein
MDIQNPETAPELVRPGLDFPVIGIGASAGGLEAVTAMFRDAPPAPGMAYVLVQHLDPNHESMMAELLSRKTRIRVRQLEDGGLIECDTFYIIPPGHSLSIDRDRFVLEDFSEPRGLRRPIDTFFESLARHQGDLCAAVVLSGTGADGATGLRVIKDKGGVCVAQTPDEARYDGMPGAAIATGLTDYALPAGKIIGELNSYFERRELSLRGEASKVADHIDDLCGILRDVTGHDFSGYKKSTITRRIERRMQILGHTDAKDYLDHLQGGGDECQNLFQDLLINVTSFFRDKEYFDLLRDRTIEPLVQGMSAADELRVWVPGCSTGQEAYTIGMLIDEAAAKFGRRPLVQVFATDIDEQVLQTARQARYPAAQLLDIPERFREQYTIGLDGQFQIVPRIRDMMRFSSHSLIKDPPFTKLDLISCRNLLIYLGESIHRAVVPLMHYALRPGGYLFLGPSESLSRREDLFNAVDHRARLFRKKDVAARYPLDLIMGQRTDNPKQSAPARGRMAAVQPEDRDASNLLVYERFAPPFVRVESDGTVISSSGDLSPYLKAMPGAGSVQIGGMARPGLREVLGSLIPRVREKGERMAVKDVEVTSNFGTQTVDVVAEPLPDGNFAIVFIAVAPFRQKFDQYYTEAGSRDDIIDNLEQELRLARFRLGSTVEELETANEELKSSNEEMMSMNEELQSANEELSTANEELKNKVDELNIANDDLDNVLRSINTAILVLDSNFRIRTFTEEARELFELKTEHPDVPVSAASLKFDEPEFIGMVKTCIETGEPCDRAVTIQRSGRVFIMRILPYRTALGGIAGATVALNDVSDLKALESSLVDETQRLHLAMTAGQMGVWEYEPHTGKAVHDDRVAQLFGLPCADTYHLDTVVGCIHERDRQDVREALAGALIDKTEYDAEFRVVNDAGETRWLKGIGKVTDTPGGNAIVFGLNYDITFEREALEQQNLLVQEMNHRVKNLFAVISSLIGSTARSASNLDDFAKQLRSRVSALGRAYEISRSDGSLTEVDLKDLISSVLLPHAKEGQVSYEGGTLHVPAGFLTPLGLIVHELATNAVKYGSLAHADGRLEISWKRDKQQGFVITWRELTPGGAEKPNDIKGFGTRLIDASVQQLRGSVERKWSDKGLLVTLTIEQS